MWYLPTEVKRSSNISSGQQARSETYKTREGRRYDVTLASHRSFFFYLLYVPSLRALPCQVEPNWSGVSEYTYGVHSCNVYKTLTCEPNICNPLPRRNERPFFIARQQNATALRSLSQPHLSPCLACLFDAPTHAALPQCPLGLRLSNGMQRSCGNPRL